MKLREGQSRLQDLLKETITLLCKNGLHFTNGFIIDALIGITTDDSETFLLKLEETVGDVGDKQNTESENVDSDGKSRASRKRPSNKKTRHTPKKRQRAGSDDDGSDDDFRDDYDDHDDYGYDNNENNDYNNDDYDNSDMNNVKGEQSGHQLIVKQEQSDYCGQYTQDAQSQPYGATPGGDGQYAQDDQSHIDQAPPDGSVDGGSHDGSSSTWNQSSTNNDTNAAAAPGSQKVRVFS